MNVFKKIKKLRTLSKRVLKQSGQVMLLYAFSVPLLFLFLGVTLDLGWYYVNVSRMQNAADAAVLAGAQTLTDTDQILSGYDFYFVKGFNENEVGVSSSDISSGDEIAKIYVGKNVGRNGSVWYGDSITDLWTREDLYFASELLRRETDESEAFYYHVTLEEDVPHLLLSSLEPMNAKVSAVAKIINSYYMSGYDLFEQMKNLETKHTFESWEDILKNQKRIYSDDTIAEQESNSRSVSADVISDEKNSRRTETLNLTYDAIKQNFDGLFAGLIPDTSAQATEDQKNDKIHRIINVDTVYPVREYKETLDPLYVRIESEPKDASVRQIIINVNVSNMDSYSDRPIVFFYEGSTRYESLPVIFNLNADFRGILFAPNSPVVINGNYHEFQGFVIAESFVQLMTESDIDDLLLANDVEYTASSDVVGYFKIDTNGKSVYLDNFGNIQYETDEYGNIVLAKKEDYIEQYENDGKIEFVDSEGIVQYEKEEGSLVKAVNGRSDVEYIQDKDGNVIKFIDSFGNDLYKVINKDNAEKIFISFDGDDNIQYIEGKNSDVTFFDGEGNFQYKKITDEKGNVKFVDSTGYVKYGKNINSDGNIEFVIFRKNEEKILYKEIKDDKGNSIFVDSKGNVQYKELSGETPTIEDFGLSDSTFDSFDIVDKSYLPNNFLTKTQAESLN